MWLIGVMAVKAEVTERRQIGTAILTQTTMTIPSLPQETLDFIVDLLLDEPEALKACCLSSKLWIPRARKHLFAKIELRSKKDFESWKKAFPDPSNSPADHTHTISVRCAPLVSMADVRAGGLIQTFPRVVRLKLDWIRDSSERLSQRAATEELKRMSLTPFYGFSSTLKSLHLRLSPLPCGQIFDFVRASPLLEDLTLFGLLLPSSEGGDLHGPQIAASPTSPALTGCLDLHIRAGIGPSARQLLDLPGGLHFRKLMLSWFREGDLRWVTELVVRCTNTLEYIGLECTFVLVPSLSCSLSPSAGESGPASVDLSKVAKLREVVFLPQSPAVAWITAALQTITEHQDLQHISIHAPFRFTFIKSSTDVRQDIGGGISEQWSDLDRLLVRLWESRSIRPKVVCKPLERENRNTRRCIGCLLPEMTERGIIDLV